MERIAFGPPAVNAAKLLALIEAGLVDLTHVRGGELTSRGRAHVCAPRTAASRSTSSSMPCCRAREPQGTAACSPA